MPPFVSARDFGLPESVVCPFCAGLETEMHAGFGGQLSVASYWCRRCRTAFECFKPGAARPSPVDDPAPEGLTGKRFPEAEN